ncbi:MAG TPA: hypothetical protein VJA25_09900 [Dehalococcoidia bacterium]|nr:hypothetical protein [Dehalococcoidia bacterium]
MPKHKGKGSPTKVKFPHKQMMVNGIVAGGMEKMHRKAMGKRRGR